MTRQEKLVKKVNKIFPASDPKYPVCFIRDNYVIVSSERCAITIELGVHFDLPIIDYYGEFRDGTPWIEPYLEYIATDFSGYWEWESPECVIFCE